MVSEDGENQDVDEASDAKLCSFLFHLRLHNLFWHNSNSLLQVVKEAFQQMRSNGVTVPLLHVHHPHHKKPAENGYFKLSRHFKWALNEVFCSLYACLWREQKC